MREGCKYGVVVKALRSSMALYRSAVLVNQCDSTSHLMIQHPGLHLIPRLESKP